MAKEPTTSKWYNNELIVTMQSRFSTSRLNTLSKNNYLFRSLKITLFGLFIISVVACNTEPSSQSASANSESKIDNSLGVVKEKLEEPKLNEEQVLRQRLTNEIKENNEKKFDGSLYRGSLKSLNYELVLFSVWKNLINEAADYKDAEIKKLHDEFKTQVQEIQVSEFPKMREEFKNIVHDMLSPNGIVTRIKGKGNTTLEFVSTAFKSKEMEQLAHKNVLTMLENLRFKKSNYKLTQYDDNYTTYTLTPPKDSAIAKIFEE